MNAAVTVRAERAGDYDAVRRVNELAFGQPGEAALVDALRASARPYVSLVAEDEGGRVVGHIFFSPVTVEPHGATGGAADMTTSGATGGETTGATDDETTGTTGGETGGESAGDSSFAAMGLAPMAVLPELQRGGVGSRLVRAGLEECARAGAAAVFVLGHADYYPRFGFAPAARRGFACEYPVPEEVFMVLELRPGALAGRAGLVKYHPEFARL